MFETNTMVAYLPGLFVFLSMVIFFIRKNKLDAFLCFSWIPTAIIVFMIMIGLIESPDIHNAVALSLLCNIISLSLVFFYPKNKVNN